MALTSYDRRLAIRTQLEQLLLLVTCVIANPTPANVDAVFTAIGTATALNPLVLKPDYGLDGESYQWNAYRDSLLKSLEDIDKAIQRARPFFFLTKMRT